MRKQRPKPQAQISAERMKSAVLAVGFEIGAHGWRERRYVLKTVTLLCLRHDPTLDSAAGGEVSSVFDVQRMALQSRTRRTTLLGKRSDEYSGANSECDRELG